MGWENLLLGFSVALQPANLGLAVLGITLGTVIGVLPGLGGANGGAILLPLTFSMAPTSAIILLTSLYWGALFGGAITSILFNIPGEPGSVRTTCAPFPAAWVGARRVGLALQICGQGRKDVERQLHRERAYVAAVERMWPVLT